MSVQSLAADLQRALGLSVTCGQITLNINEGQVQSVETHTKMRIQAPIETVTRRTMAVAVDNSAVVADISATS